MTSEHDQDVASFALLAQSFDTLSDAEHFLRPTPERATDQPPLKICVGPEERGDISPIKLEGAILEGADRNQKDYCDDPGTENPSARDLYGTAEPVSFAPMPYPSSKDNHEQHNNAHHEYHHHDSQEERPIYNAKGYSATASNPFFVLRCVSKIFDSFSYKLSCLDEGSICPVNIGPHSSTFSRYSQMEGNGIDVHDLEKACSRVETALCAFGGTSTATARSSYAGIFRPRRSYDDEYYENTFHHRYTVKRDHIYWELESSPPVHGSSEPWESGDPSRPDLLFQGPSASLYYSPGISATSSSSVVPVDRYQKMRYRCKLCHQLKQNHDCPFRNSLHRSIGVTVHASINAFQAAEPGRLAPPLSEMNSCVTFFEDENGLSPDHMREAATPRISPETNQTRPLHYSPESSLSTDSGHHNGRIAPSRPPAPHTAPKPFGVTDKPLFVQSVDLKPGQLRIVTSSEHLVGSTSFSYPAVPLPYEQRKRLSDTLFALAGQVPCLKEECAALLRCARGNNEWDLGVAQLLCQLVVGLYCAEGDFCLDGLKRYLQRMGISC